jgi:cobalt-zinc-cadmium efflux system protein
MTVHHHGPGSHAGAAAGPRNSRYLAGALALILAFMAAEVVVGIIASSLALISDAGRDAPIRRPGNHRSGQC